MGASNKIQISGHSVKANLEVITFKEAELTYVGYAPAIEVSSYGETEKEALDAVREAIGIYFEYTRNKGTLEKDLIRMGWKVISCARLLWYRGKRKWLNFMSN